MGERLEDHQAAPLGTAKPAGEGEVVVWAVGTQGVRTAPPVVARPARDWRTLGAGQGPGGVGAVRRPGRARGPGLELKRGSAANR